MQYATEGIPRGEHTIDSERYMTTIKDRNLAMKILELFKNYKSECCLAPKVKRSNPAANMPKITTFFSPIKLNKQGGQVDANQQKIIEIESAFKKSGEIFNFFHKTKDILFSNV